MILDVRGTHGSGKSYVMHSILKRYKHNKIIGRCERKKKDNYHLGYHLPEIDAAIIGRYESACGGCDGVGSPDEICRRLRMFNEQHGIVLLEGIMVAHTFKRYSSLAKELDDYRFLFLNTPLATCIRRVKSRRASAGNTTPFNPKNLIHDYKQIWIRTRANCKKSNHNVVELSWKDPMPQVFKIIEEAR